MQDTITAPNQDALNKDQPRRKLYQRLWVLAPPCAGVAIGLSANWLVIDERLLATVWRGASIDPDAVPGAWLMRGLGLLTGIALWVLSALLVRSPGGFRQSMWRVSPGFAGFLPILALNFIDAYAATETMYWSVLATIYALAFLAAYLVALASSESRSGAMIVKDVVTRRAVAIVAVAAAAYFAVSWTMSLLQYRALRISYHDCAGFDEMLWRTLHGQFMRASCFERSFLGQHFEFIHLLLLPVYVLWPGLPVLMLTQSLGLASGVIPVYLLAVRKLSSRAAAVLFCLAYLFYAPMQYADKRLIFEIYLPETLAIPALLWVLYFFETKNMRGLLVSSLLAAACKEDMVLPVAMAGIVLVARGRIKWGFAFFLGASAWFLLALTVVIPYFEGGPSHVVTYFHDMGGSVRSVIANVVQDPLYALRFAFASHRVDFLLMMLVPMGMLALCSPAIVFIFLPSIASNSLASWAPSSQIFYHYHISLVPFAVGGAVFGAANLVRLGGCIRFTWGGMGEPARKELAAVFCGTLVLASSVLGDVAYGKFPISLNFYNPRSPGYWRHLYVQSPSARSFIREVLPTIPKEAKVCATQFLATRFTHHAAAYTHPSTAGGIEKADYFVMELDAPDNPSLAYSVSRYCDPDAIDYAPELAGFVRVLEKDGIYVYKRELAGDGVN